MTLDETRGIGSAVLGPLPVRAPFNRKNWDNPFKFKLNRQCGDEFEYANFAQLARRWTMVSQTAANFGFRGGSSLEWKTTGTAQAMYVAIPPYDFEAVLEYQRPFLQSGGNKTDNWPGIAIVNTAGTGLGVGVHEDTNIYHNFITAWADPGSFSNSVASGLSGDGRHQWLSLRRVGGQLQARASNNGTSWGSFSTLESHGVTAAYLALVRYRSLGLGTATAFIHRFNVYAAPGYFPG